MIAITEVFADLWLGILSSLTRMVASHHITRIDTPELKNLIYQKIGHQRSESYFVQLKRFLGLKLSKADFDRSCIKTIGRENIPLHNRLIRAILQNSCEAKIPPQKARKVEGLGVKVANGYQRNCLQSLYGDGMPSSPHNSRFPINQDRKFRDRPSPLGPLGKSPSVTYEETISRIQEQQSGTELCSISSKPPTGVAFVEDGEEVEQFAGIPSRWKSVTAPLGVSLKADRIHQAPHSVDARQNFAVTCQGSCELPDTSSLRSLLEKKFAQEGVSISLESANVLNKGLDLYLKRLLEHSVGVAGSRFKDQYSLLKQQSSGVISGSNRTLPLRHPQMAVQPALISMLDFRVAMETNPCILGEDWSIRLEKICHYSFY